MLFNNARQDIYCLNRAPRSGNNRSVNSLVRLSYDGGFGTWSALLEGSNTPTTKGRDAIQAAEYINS